MHAVLLIVPNLYVWSPSKAITLAQADRISSACTPSLSVAQTPNALPARYVAISRPLAPCPEVDRGPARVEFGAILGHSQHQPSASSSSDAEEQGISTPVTYSKFPPLASTSSTLPACRPHASSESDRSIFSLYHFHTFLYTP